MRGRNERDDRADVADLPGGCDTGRAEGARDQPVARCRDADDVRRPGWASVSGSSTRPCCSPGSAIASPPAQSIRPACIGSPSPRPARNGVLRIRPRSTRTTPRSIRAVSRLGLDRHAPARCAGMARALEGAAEGRPGMPPRPRLHRRSGGPSAGAPHGADLLGGSCPRPVSCVRGSVAADVGILGGRVPGQVRRKSAKVPRLPLSPLHEPRLISAKIRGYCAPLDRPFSVQDFELYFGV